MSELGVVSHASNQSPAKARGLLADEVLDRSQRQQGLTFLVDGLAGMGKTYLLHSLIDAAIATGEVHVSFVRADEIEQGEPYSFIERFVATSSIPDWDFTPDEFTDPVALARECVQRLVPAIDAPMRLIVIDDAQWIDAESQRVLRFMIPRVTTRNVTLAFGVRTPHVPGSFGQFLAKFIADSPLDLHIPVSPFTLQEIVAYTLERVGVGISSVTAQRIFDESGGSFLGIESVLSSLSASEISELPNVWDNPARPESPRSDKMLHLFTDLSNDAQRTTEIVCLAGHEITTAELTEVSGLLGAPLALEEAVAGEVLTKSGFGRSIMPRHALLAQAIVDTVEPERTREVYRALAEVTEGYRSLRHSLLGAETWTEDLGERVSEFVAGCSNKSTSALASDILRAALDLATDEFVRASLLESLVLVHMRAKTGYLILDLLPEIEALPPSVLHEFMAIVLAAHQVGEQLSMERVQRLLMTQAQDPDEQVVLGFFAFMVVILSMRTSSIEAVPALIGSARYIIEAGPTQVSALEDKRLAWMMDSEGYLLVLDAYLMVQDQILGQTDRVAEALPDLTRRIHALSDSSLKVDASVAVAGAMLAIGDIEGGRSLAQMGVDLLGRVDEPWAASTARLILADCMVLQGSFDEAAELMQLTEELSYASLDTETRFTWAALRVFIGAATGQGNAEKYLDQARHQTAVAWVGYGPDLFIIAECELARAQGDAAAVLAASADERTAQVLNTRHGFLTYRAHALISLGKIEEASTLIDQLAGWRGVQWQECWGSIDWLRARLAQALHDESTAQWHYEAAVGQQKFMLPYALTMLDYGEFLMRHGDPTQARQTLRTGVDVLEALGANGYLPRANALLESLGVEEKRPVGGAAEHLIELLTHREKQIVAHLIKGRSNNQIAESLLVSVTTIRSHVSNLLRKLQLSSRGEVARLFREDLPDATMS